MESQDNKIKELKTNLEILQTPQNPFKIGDIVICVKANTDKSPILEDYIFPQVGKKYTVRELDAEIGIKLNEIVNPIVQTFDRNNNRVEVEIAFSADYFVKKV